MTTKKPVSIVLMNDYELVVQGLAQMLAPFSERVEVVELVAGTNASRDADIVLYDNFAAELGESLKGDAVLQHGRARRLVIWSWQIEPALIRNSMNNGAHGYLSKGLNAEELVEALERIHADEEVVSSLALDEESLNHPGANWPGKQEGLSQREAEVIALVTQGLSNQDIADKAYLSINTVKSYIRSSYRKMGVTSRSRALLWGLEHGFGPDNMRLKPSDFND